MKRFNAGDKVIVVISEKQGKRGGYTNGEIGVIESVNRYKDCYSVTFDKGREYFGVDFDELQPLSKLHKALE